MGLGPRNSDLLLDHRLPLRNKAFSTHNLLAVRTLSRNESLEPRRRRVMPSEPRRANARAKRPLMSSRIGHVRASPFIFQSKRKRGQALSRDG